MNKEAFAGWLKRRREDLNLTQPELATRAGVQKAYISKIENASQGEPSLKFLLKLSKGLGASLAEVLTEMGYLKPEYNLEPHVMRVLHYYQSLPEPDQRLAEELIKTLWRERGHEIREEDEPPAPKPKARKTA